MIRKLKMNMKKKLEQKRNKDSQKSRSGGGQKVVDDDITVEKSDLEIFDLEEYTGERKKRKKSENTARIGTRITPQLFKMISVAARLMGIGINEYIERMFYHHAITVIEGGKIKKKEDIDSGKLLELLVTASTKK